MPPPLMRLAPRNSRRAPGRCPHRVDEAGKKPARHSGSFMIRMNNSNAFSQSSASRPNWSSSRRHTRGSQRIRKLKSDHAFQHSHIGISGSAELPEYEVVSTIDKQKRMQRIDSLASGGSTARSEIARSLRTNWTRMNQAPKQPGRAPSYSDVVNYSYPLKLRS
jgi:hypothetical protein